ncbi:hypothetical protein BHE74_00041932 [Ensete ventricosum]|nr:hypothetical protein BHE74_00041932 [Ensete ventricosum]
MISSGGTGTPAIRYFRISAWCSSSCHCRRTEKKKKKKKKNTRKNPPLVLEITHGRGRERRSRPPPLRGTHKVSPSPYG